MTSITRERLIAYAAGEIDGPEAAEVAAHLVANPEAARLLHLYRTVAKTTAEDDTESAPAELITRARAILRAEAPATRGLVDRLTEILAHLVYDSRLQPAATRATAAAAGIQLSFEAGDCEIDLRAEPLTAGPTDAANVIERWRAVGQVLSSEDIGAVTVTAVTADAEPVTEVRSDDRALFTLELPPGCYDLRIAIGDEVLVLTGIDIG